MKSPPIEVHEHRGQLLGMPPAKFLRDYWQKRPLLIRNAFADFKPPLSPNDLAGLACEETALSRIVALKGAAIPKTSSFRGRASARNDENETTSPTPGNDRWTLRNGPFAETNFAKLSASHWSLLVQDVDKWDGDVAALLDRFDFLPSWRIDDVMVSYATDGGGVGPHIDQYDVFLLQGIGQRRWRISVDPNASKDFRNDTELKLLRRFEPTHTWTLESGDMLYLPPGVPHEGVAIGECMTFSIGMRAPSAAEMLIDLAGFIAEWLPEEQRYIDAGLRPMRDSGEIDEAAFARVVEALPWLQMGGEVQKHVGDITGYADGVPASLLRTWFGRFITSYRSAQIAALPTRAVTAKTIDAKLERSTFARHPWSRFAFRRSGRGAALYVSGEEYGCPLAWARVLAGRERVIEGARLAKLPQRAAGVAVLAALIGAGHLRRLRG